MIYGKDRQVQYIGNSVAEARAPTEGRTEHILLGGVMEYCGAQVTPGLGFYFFFLISNSHLLVYHSIFKKRKRKKRRLQR